MNGSTQNGLPGQASSTVETRSLVREAQFLAHWLCCHEAVAGKPHEADQGEALCVFEKLRKPLSVLAGTAAYKALISRAQALARTDDPSGRDTMRGERVVAQLLNLLIGFIGYPLTLRIVRDIWPDAPSGQANTDSEKLP